MKYAIIILGGAADLPVESIGDRTPLEVAKLPNIARAAAMGKVGRAYTTPLELEPESDVCAMSILGYDPLTQYPGRAPLEALGRTVDCGGAETIFRMDLITTGSDASPHAGRIIDPLAGGISNGEAAALLHGLMEFWSASQRNFSDAMRITHVMNGRHLAVDVSARDYAELRTTPPHAIVAEPLVNHLPAGGKSSPWLRELILSSKQFLSSHEVNLARIEQGLRPANMAWFWAQGRRPRLQSFRDRYGLRGAMISTIDVLAGLAAAIGWDRTVPDVGTRGAPGDTASRARETVRALNAFDVACCHIETPDEASHAGDVAAKIAALEAIDRDIVGPVLDALMDQYGEPGKEPPGRGWRLLVIPDHYTVCATRKHDANPVPFLIAGSWIRAAVARPFTEEAADESDLQIDPGHDLMEYFLKSGLTGSRARS